MSTTTKTEQLIYLNPEWQSVLRECELDSFEALWQLKLTAVDEGNTGRGKNGWSRVSIFTFEDRQHQPRKVVIKRQSNYFSRTLAHPLRGIPTFLKEMASITRYEKARVPALKAVYCATRQLPGELQAILITEFLTGYQPLETILDDWQQHGRPATKECREVTRATAELIALLHHQGLEHRCLFPKHIFLSDENGHKIARLIDLEKTRWRPWRDTRRTRDLTALARRSTLVQNKDRVHFLYAYYGITKLDQRAKKLWRQVAARINHKKR